MNLAIEYFVRSGEAKRAIEFPCSLFLTNLYDSQKRLIVTIKWHKFNKEYVVQRWCVDEFQKDTILPEFEEKRYKNINDLFGSEFVIVPGYRMLPFVESPYKCGIWQRGEGNRAEIQEKEYEDTIESFLNPEIHQKLRERWLWFVFIRSYNEAIEEYNSYCDFEIHTTSIKLLCPNIWNKYIKWSNYFLPKVKIATELVFKEPYDSLINEKEVLSVLFENWKPWRVLGIKDQPNKIFHYNSTTTFIPSFTVGNPARRKRYKKLYDSINSMCHRLQQSKRGNKACSTKYEKRPYQLRNALFRYISYN